MHITFLLDFQPVYNVWHGTPGQKSNIIPLRISIALLRLKCCSVKLLLRVGLIHAVYTYQVFMCLHSMHELTRNRSTALQYIKHFKCGNAIEICNAIMFNFYPGLPHVALSSILRCNYHCFQVTHVMGESLTQQEECATPIWFLYLPFVQMTQGISSEYAQQVLNSEAILSGVHCSASLLLCFHSLAYSLLIVCVILSRWPGVGITWELHTLLVQCDVKGIRR